MNLHEIDQFFRVQYQPFGNLAAGPRRMVAIEVSSHQQLD